MIARGPNIKLFLHFLHQQLNICIMWCIEQVLQIKRWAEDLSLTDSDRKWQNRWKQGSSIRFKPAPDHVIGTHYHSDLTGTKNATFVAQNSELKLAKSAIWLCTTNEIAKRIQRLSENWSLWFLWVIWFWVKSLRLFQVIFRLWTFIRTLFTIPDCFLFRLDAPINAS